LQVILVGLVVPAVAGVGFELPALPYAFDALEPHIDVETMKVHHGKHHAAYVAGLNAAGAQRESGKAEAVALAELQADAPRRGVAVRNHGGGHYNHALFWVNLVAASTSTEPSPDLAAAIEDRFGSFEKMQQEFEKAALGRFGSGWVWLGVKPDGALTITSTANQDNPLMSGLEYPVESMVPILGLDVWEHAYYLKYQNRRADYVKAFWHVVNWMKVSRNFENYAKRGKPVPPTPTGGGHAMEL